LHILNNIVINRFNFLKGVRVELFPPPPTESDQHLGRNK
jgi:hypothetical protein